MFLIIFNSVIPFECFIHFFQVVDLFWLVNSSKKAIWRGRKRVVGTRGEKPPGQPAVCGPWLSSRKAALLPKPSGLGYAVAEIKKMTLGIIGSLEMGGSMKLWGEKKKNSLEGHTDLNLLFSTFVAQRKLLKNLSLKVSFFFSFWSLKK